MDMEGAEIAEHDGGGRKAESDIVGQGVELLANRGGYVQQTGHHTVEEIEDGTDHDEEQRHVGNAHEGPIGRNAT